MKARGYLAIVGLIAIVAFACKKDITPQVRYTVVDTTGAKLVGARVYTHPCFDTLDCINFKRINVNFIKEGLTNSAGQVTFEYPYSAIIEVKGEYFPCDTTEAGGEWCPYVGYTVARFETKRAPAGEENIYDVRVVLRKLF